MSYSIVITKDIRRQLERLPGHIKPVAKQLLLALPDNPRLFQAKQLDGHPNYYRALDRCALSLGLVDY